MTYDQLYRFIMQMLERAGPMESRITTCRELTDALYPIIQRPQ